MSQANIPNITPNISLTRDDAINMILSSVAMEEMGISHILNAEGEKIQFVLGTLNGITGPGATIADILAVNNSVQTTIKEISKLNHHLSNKIELTTSLPNMIGPTGPTGPVAEIPETFSSSIFSFSGTPNLSPINGNSLDNYAILTPIGLPTVAASLPTHESVSPTINFDAPIEFKQFLLYGFSIPYDGYITSINGFGMNGSNFSPPIGEEVSFHIRLYKLEQGSLLANEIINSEQTFTPPLSNSSQFYDTCYLSSNNLMLPLQQNDRVYAIIFATSTNNIIYSDPIGLMASINIAYRSS